MHEGMSDVGGMNKGMWMGVLMNEWVSVGWEAARMAQECHEQLVFHIQWKERSLWAKQEVLLGKEKLCYILKK